MKQPETTLRDVYTSQEFLDMFIRNNYVLHFKEQTTEGTSSPYDIFFPQETTVEEETTAAKPSEIIRESAHQGEMTNQTSTTEYSYEDALELLEFVEERYSIWNTHFQELAPYMEYEVLDPGSEELVQSNTSGTSSLFEKTKQNLKNEYAFLLSVSYNSDGYVSDVSFFPGGENSPRELLKSLAVADPYENFYEYYGLIGKLQFQMPANRTYTYAMTEENLRVYLTVYPEIAHETAYERNDDYRTVIPLTLLALGILVACGALFLPFVKSFATGNGKIFCLPFEFTFLVCLGGFLIFVFIMDFAFGYSSYNFAWEQETRPMYDMLLTLGIPGDAAGICLSVLSFTGWTLVFALVYWGFGCMRRIFQIGPKAYIQKHVLTYRFLSFFGGKAFRWTKQKVQSLYQSLLHVNLTENTNRILLKVVVINFLICTTICILWFFGVAALLVYSIILFFLLRKYCDDLRKQYQQLLLATNELAKGNLNGTIPENLGVFEPFRDEIRKIQEGFKKAVDEEVKSTRMKTDLITNVSHDLKTPLTAIITYVDLLKKEDLPAEEGRKYIQILDQKANRLKILIEDLFEVSKATSKTVTLNIMDVDIVSLLQQVKLELQDKIDATNLTFRWQLPEEKVILPLDSQRTYRVFENLLVNITKYAMPHTRVYINMENSEKQVKITMKNISATELNFNPNEITERFVRGDASRNTEGSGLGLAIAKSFTELQGGKLEIFTDADLFTAEITFLK